MIDQADEHLRTHRARAGIFVENLNETLRFVESFTVLQELVFPSLQKSRSSS